ncbi:glycoside hydrolase family 92 protein [Phyllobacterium sp. 628]|uniref:GH92 family glycosyl hydrolase n=1 Tax=Phyllobacterium sp. 628 TaxID=2718938 RepID=UPI0016627002|nr:GH92 family glycosyl hydrolase [Phyllobacterium sp. 628]QND51265.1 glycoside hydrolase family 92 protein [Phyllobacterium sp. 628]
MTFKKVILAGLLSCTMLAGCHDEDKQAAASKGTFAGDATDKDTKSQDAVVAAPQTQPDATKDAAATLQDQDLAGYVNIMRGAHSAAYIADGYSRGNTFPAMALPFGFNMWSPVNRSAKCDDSNFNNTKLCDGYKGNDFFYTFYENRDDTKLLGSIQAFAVVHEPSPWIGNRQTLQIMPVSKTDASGNLLTDRMERAEKFQRSNETAHAHYYGITFDNGTRTEMTPTDHAAYFRFTASATQPVLTILFDTFAGTSGTITIDKANGVVSGSTDHGAPRMYFYAKFDDTVTQTKQPDAAKLTSWLQFDTSGASKIVGLKIATSFLSVDQAKSNLEQEIGTKTFNDVEALAKAAWNKKLNIVQVEGATEDQKTILYSNMYRSFLYPNSAWENVAGVPTYMSPYTSPPAPKKGKIWVNNGFWDTYRTTWPLYTLLFPNAAGEMIDGFINGYKDGGWVTRWSGPGYADMMVATSSDIIFADAYMKGVRNFDIASAYASMVKNASVYSSDDSRGRKGMNETPFYGYSRLGDENVSWSLEGYLNDFGVAQMATALGKTDDAAYFSNSAINYAKIFDGESTGTWAGGWFRKRASDTSWANTNSTPQSWYGAYTEGNAWHYAFLAPQDGQGLANLYGGRDKLKAKLDAFFTTPPLKDGDFYISKPEIVSAYDVSKAANVGEYQHSNQPVHHSIYMYNYAGAPASGQKYLRDVMDKLYFSGFDANGNQTGNGYLGDEDNGEMSAWYVWSAMGVYPVSAGRPEYAIGAPYFPKMTVRVEDAKGAVHQIVIQAPNVSSSNRYVQSVKLDGKPVSHNYLLHSQIANGALLEFDMGPNPSQWGTGADDAPASITTGSAKPRPFTSLLVDKSYAVTASNAVNTDSLYDRNSSTAWNGTAPTWVEADKNAPKAGDSVLLYTLTSAAAAEGDPVSWTLKGSNDGTNWTVLDERKDQKFEWRQQVKPFALKTPAAYSRYRLEIGGTKPVNLSEFELLGYPATP